MEEKRLKIQRVIKDIRSLPTLPGVIKKLTSISEDNKATVEEMARVVSADHTLSAKVLKLVNSPFYGFPGRISTVSHALVLLGVNVIKSLALCSSIFELMEKSVVGLWEHSLGAGMAAQIISKKLGLPDAEEISTAALLHDIGKVIIKINLHEECKNIEMMIAEKEIPMIEAEREILETDHADIGEWLGQNWFLPEKLIEPIACHHNVEKSEVYRNRTSVVHLADVLIKASGFGFSGDDFVPLLHPTVWKDLDLSDALMEELIEEIEDKIVEIKNFSLEIQSENDTQT